MPTVSVCCVSVITFRNTFSTNRQKMFSENVRRFSEISWLVLGSFGKLCKGHFENVPSTELAGAVQGNCGPQCLRTALARSVC